MWWINVATEGNVKVTKKSTNSKISIISRWEHDQHKQQWINPNEHGGEASCTRERKVGSCRRKRGGDFCLLKEHCKNALRKISTKIIKLNRFIKAARLQWLQINLRTIFENCFSSFHKNSRAKHNVESWLHSNVNETFLWWTLQSYVMIVNKQKHEAFIVKFFEYVFGTFIRAKSRNTKSMSLFD
jgi:hypothetical protein